MAEKVVARRVVNLQNKGAMRAVVYRRRAHSDAQVSYSVQGERIDVIILWVFNMPTLHIGIDIIYRDPEIRV